MFRRFCRFLGLVLLSFCFAYFSYFFAPARSNEAIDEVFYPTKLMDISGNKEVLLPDWQQISFGSMAAIGQSGSYSFQGVNRSWQAGQTPDNFLNLGDIQQLHPDLLSLSALGSDTGAELSSFPLLGKQNLNHLLEVVPSLGDFSADSVPPIAALLKGQDTSIPLKNLLAQKPELGNLKLSSVDLSQYAIGDIPNIESVPLGQLQGWQDSSLASVPGLNALPLAAFPAPVGQLGVTVAQIDMIWGRAERERQHTISGSDVAGFSVPCSGQECPYIELNDMAHKIRNGYESLSWISGKYQWVPGGWGCLSFVNGGKEPTGRFPFGSAFKVVVWEPDEHTDTVTTALFFRGQSFCGATPYIIGPVPFLTYHRDGMIFVGSLDEDQVRVHTIPPSIKLPKDSGSQFNSIVPSTGGSASPISTESVFDYGGVDLTALKSAIASIESDGEPLEIGPYVCADKGTNCGRALGQFQDMSYNPNVIQLVQAKPGGTQWLKLVASGEKITPEELFQFFPPADQETAITLSLQDKIASTSTQIDPTTGQFFTGDRLVERVAQKHFGGDSSQVDGGATDVFGRLTLKSYGETVLNDYKAFLH